jgi:23S rRNA pseudouridine955/2504/2580 synthase
LTKKNKNRYENEIMRVISLPSDEAPKTAENFLKKRFPVGYVRKLFRKNGVRLNGKRCRPKKIVRPGDALQLFIPFETQFAASALNAPNPPAAIKIVFESVDFLVINKPAGLAVHEGKGVSMRQSLLGNLKVQLASKGVTPNLVHRLDKATSGLLLVAKNEAAASELQRCFKSAAVNKEYIALVVGRIRPNLGRIELPLPGREQTLVPALTEYRVEKGFRGTSLLRVSIHTGRMHQIRLHLALMGHPVVMDEQHGDFAFNKIFRRAYGLKRQFLHAASISLEYKGQKMSWTEPLPSDLRQTLASIQTAEKAARLP